MYLVDSGCALMEDAPIVQDNIMIRSTVGGDRSLKKDSMRTNLAEEGKALVRTNIVGDNFI